MRSSTIRSPLLISKSLGTAEMKKRILMFSPLGRGEGGGETTFEIIREGLSNRGHHVVPVYNDKQGGAYLGVHKEYGGYRTPISLPNWWRHVLRREGFLQLFGSFINTIRLLYAETPSVVYVHYFSISALIFAVLKPLLQYRFVIGCQGTDIEDMYGLKSQFAQFILNYADAVTCVSNPQIRSLQDQVRVATPVHVIHNGVDVDFWKADLDRASSGQEIISVGATREEKGHDVLIRAFRQVVNRFPDSSLTIVGDGSYRDVCEELIDDLGLRSSVTITGWIDRPDIRELLIEATVFAFPSRQEAFGMALLEAMASGLPVVATDTGGIPEVTEGTDARLVESENQDEFARALMEALENREWREQAARASIQRAHELSLDMMIDRCENIIAGMS